MMKYLALILLSLTGCANTSLITLDRSWHYFDKEGRYNESHSGLGLQFQDGQRSYSIIPYVNSDSDDAVLLSTVRDGWLTGFALGYEGIKVLPVAGYQIQPLKYFRVTFTPVVAYTSIVLPFK